MNRNGKKVLILVLTLSLAATFVAPLPVIRGQDESPDVAWVDDWKEFERDSTVYFEGVKARPASVLSLRFMRPLV